MNGKEWFPSPSLPLSSFIIFGWLVPSVGPGEGGGKLLFVLSEPDLLIMVIGQTVTHRSDSDRNIITDREAIKL